MILTVWGNTHTCTASYDIADRPVSRLLTPVATRRMTTTITETRFVLVVETVLRRMTCVAAVAMLAGVAVPPLRAEDLSRWVWVARAPEADRTNESIPAPLHVPLECPTLEQLGYRTKRLADLSLNVGKYDLRLPADCSTDVFQATAPGHDGRSWFATEFNWAASDLLAQPAYFDDPVLERYGQTRHPLVQPWLSGAHFFGQFPLMPYKIVLDRPYDKVYTLGYHRPGSPMPCVARRLPRP